jgi:hypothetical protein
VEQVLASSCAREDVVSAVAPLLQTLEGVTTAVHTASDDSRRSLQQHGDRIAEWLVGVPRRADDDAAEAAAARVVAVEQRVGEVLAAVRLCSERLDSVLQCTTSMQDMSTTRLEHVDAALVQLRGQFSEDSQLVSKRLTLENKGMRDEVRGRWQGHCESVRVRECESVRV